MHADLQQLLTFLEEQKSKQASHFPAVKFEKVLSFMATTSRAGTRAAVAVCPVLGMRPVSGAKELDVRLRGPLPREPERGECITVHVTNVEQYQGYQVKSRAESDPPGPPLYEARGGVDVEVKGNHTFTVHHSPYTMKFFERIPFEEVEQIVGRVPYALVGVGEQANVSPRFVFHHEVRQDQLCLYHGDGLALKTYMNLKSNRMETRLVLDLDDFTGYALQGTVEEFQPHQQPEAYERVCQGFSAGNWGKPSRTFRLVVESWRPIAPTGPAARRNAG